jgi:O-antigen ligase
MPSSKEKSQDYSSISNGSKAILVEQNSVKSLKPARNQDELLGLDKTLSSKGFQQDSNAEIFITKGAEPFESSEIKPLETINDTEIKLTYAQTLKKEKADKATEKDRLLLDNDGWLQKNGHTFSYIGIFLFTLALYFRPYELIPGLGGLKSMALYIAVATIIIFIPTQFVTEGNFTARPPEVNYMLLLTLVALITIPIARSPSLSWEVFNDTYIRVVLMFIVMVNVIKNEARLRGLMLLSVGIGVMLGFEAFRLFREGKTTVEDYRVGVDFGGMFGNPNELALHFVMFLPVAVALGISTKRIASKAAYFVSAFFMAAGILVTYSRGAFLGLIIAGFVFAWKIGKMHKVRVVVLSVICSAIFLAAAPGGYGLRVLSIFIPGLDAVGSADQRKELLIQSLFVTLRNPWGVGMGGFTIGSSRNLQSHNAYTQVSSELGILGLFFYIMLLIIPLRKLAAIERECFASQNFSWIYYLSIGVQVSIIAYMVASFFGSVAYNWFVYFPIAYAIGIRRIYAAEKEKETQVVSDFQRSLAAI